MKQVEHIISERGSVWHYRSPRLYFIWVLFFTTCSQLEGDGRRVLMCPPHLKLQLCRAAIGSISCPWGRNSCAMFLRNYRTIASIALGLGVTIHLPQRSLLYQEEYPPDLLLLLSLAKVVLHKVLNGERIEEEDPSKNYY